MKIFILSLLVAGHSIALNAQNNIQKNDGKSFISKVAYASKKFEPNTENDGLKFEYTRHLRIKAPSILILNTKRIRQISKVEPYPINIDTDKPFPDNEVQKRLIEHYLTHLDKKINVDVSKKQHLETAHSLWLANLPVLNSTQELSGIFVERHNANNVWADTLEAEEHVYRNQYVIENDSTIKLVGESAPKKKIAIDSTTTANTNPSNGESVVAKSGGKYLRYSAVIKYNKQTGFITRMDGEVRTKETLSVLGQVIDRDVRNYFVVENVNQ